MTTDQGASARADRAFAASPSSPSPGSGPSGLQSHCAWLDVSLDFLSSALALPDNCRVLDAAYGKNGVLALLVEGPTIPPDAMRLDAMFERAADGGRRFKEWKIIAKRDPSIVVVSAPMPCVGGATVAQVSADASDEREAVVAWLERVAQARDDSGHPEECSLLMEAAGLIAAGEHHKPETPEIGGSCPICCGPVDADGMTLATPLLNEQQEGMVVAALAKARGQ